MSDELAGCVSLFYQFKKVTLTREVKNKMLRYCSHDYANIMFTDVYFHEKQTSK